MLPARLKYEIEKSNLILPIINEQKNGGDWSKFTRTTFMKIAKQINKKVSLDVINAPNLIEDNLLIGINELDRIFTLHALTSIQNFIKYLQEIPKYRTYNWISGKTLQSYWQGANAKDKKVNVLLTFLGVNHTEWDEWKSSSNSIINKKQTKETGNIPFDKQTNYLLKKYYLGYYFRYYQKADGSNCVIKTPFILKEDENGQVIAESKTVGHRYKSFSIQISDGALYIDFKNIDWDEREHHIFNIGIATSPKVLIGVSNSLNIRKQAIAKRNVIIRQNHPYNFEKTGDIEIPYSKVFESKTDDSIVVDFFKKRKNNLIITSLYYSMDELQSLNHNPI